MLNISIKKFYDTLSTITGYDEKDLLPESKLIEDLGLDSFMIMDLYGSLVPPELKDKNAALLAKIVKEDVTVKQVIEIFGIQGEQKKEVKPEACNLNEFPEIVQFEEYFEKNKEKAPYFRVNDGLPDRVMKIEGEEKINFSTYNYLGLNGDKRISDFAKQAVEKFGTSVSGSRLLTGEISLHRQLEQTIAKFLGTEDAIVQVGGHSTNVNTIGNIVGSSDLILHDSLSHNSIIQGCILSHATRKPFKHNDMQALEKELKKIRSKFRRTLIVVEGVYSMDGDISNLPELIRIKKEYGCILMIDEAHSFGTIGDHGRGVTSYWNVNPCDVDILMGTLSKSACSCGGYIAGSSRFIHYLKYNSPGFIFSCGMTPCNTAAALKAIQIFSEDDSKLKKLKENSVYFLQKMKEAGFDTGLSSDTPVIPLIIGDSEKAMVFAEELYKKGINAMPIVYPAVKESEARIRFFISANHLRKDLDYTIQVLKDLRDKI